MEVVTNGALADSLLGRLGQLGRAVERTFETVGWDILRSVDTTAVGAREPVVDSTLADQHMPEGNLVGMH